MRRVPRFSILAKGTILLGVPLVFQLGMLAYLSKVHHDVAEAERWEAHTKEVLEQANSVRLALVQGHSALRGIDTFHDPSFELEEQRGLFRIPQQLRNLQQLVSDNPQQQRRLDEQQTSMGLYLAWVSQVQELARAARWADFTRELLSLEGKGRLDAVESQLVQFRRVEENLDAQRRTAAEQSRHKQRMVLIAAGAAMVLLALALMIAFTRSIGARLRVATQNARRMAEGTDLASPVRGTDEIAHLDAVLHDTARRLREAAAKEREFSAELQQRSEKLAQANEELLYKTQENETFVYSVSHDLRSPLVNLQGFTRELSHGCHALREALDQMELSPPVRRRVDSIIDEDIVTSTRFIQTAVTRSANIINALLKLSRAGRVEYLRQAVDTDALVRRIVASMRISLDEKQAQVQVHPLPRVLADPTALEQVLANLIVNAINYLDPARPGRIEVGVVPAANGDGGRVTLFVRDNGLGIPAAYLSKLFVAFQRLHGDVAPGEGIGLALVKRIVDRHGGRIWAESTEGAGTVFYLALPRADAAAEGASAIAATPAAAEEQL